MNEGVIPQDATEAQVTTHINQLSPIIKVITVLFLLHFALYKLIYVTIGQQRCDFCGPSRIHWDVGRVVR